MDAEKSSIVSGLAIHASESAGIRVVSIVNSRPTYYEMLGLNPCAPGEAIAQAFARATSVVRPHAFGTIAEVCLAYQTLRDPVRRRVYDASIGLMPEPGRPLSLRPASAHFATRPAMAAVPSFSVPVPEVRQSDPEIQSEPQPDSGRPLHLGGEWSGRPSIDDRAVGFRPIEWKRSGAIIGSLVAVAVFFGAMAGWWSGNSAAEPERPAGTARALDQKEAPNFSELWEEPSPNEASAQPASPARAIASRPTRVDPAPRRKQLAVSAAEAELIQPPQDVANPEPAPADPLAPELVAAPAVAAAMPLPHRTVARTIDRIGYRCGSVTSAMPVDGATGVYKVTCASGQSFQAKPVNGRYRFRRL